ncbi:MAG: ribonuclease III [Planctomycetota bacterium]
MAVKKQSPDPVAARKQALRRVQKQIGHQFKDVGLLDRALSHSSLGNVGLPNYERLEFLGDAILGFLVADHLYRRKPEVAVGDLTERRASLVSRQPLAKVATELRLSEYLTVGKGLPQDARRSNRILADLVEAVLAAIYLDGGINAARRFVKRHILQRFQDEILARRPQVDAKTRLNQLAQSRNLGAPDYQVISASGPDHRPTFRVAVTVGSVTAESPAAKSKLGAEQEAAAQALAMLKEAADADSDGDGH